MKRERGLSLVEGLVAVLIVALATTFITVRFDERQDTGLELERLRLVLESAAEQSEIQGTPLMLELLPAGYRISRLKTQGVWTPVQDDALLAARSLPAQWTWQGLEIEGQSASAVVFSNGMPSFALRIGLPTGLVTLRGQTTGSVRYATDSGA